MSTAGSALMACPDVQAELNGLFINCDPATIGFSSPFLEFLISSRNRRGIQQLLNPGPGKKRGIQLRYDQAIPITQVTAGTITDIDCTATTERGDLTASYDLPEEVLFIEEKLDYTQFELICRNNDQAIARKINLMLKALREKVAQATSQQVIDDALWGQWSEVSKDQYPGPGVPGINPAEELEVKTLKTGSEDPYYKTLQDIDGAFKMSQYCEAGVIFGGYTLYDYYKTLRAGCCADNGIDLGQQIGLYGMAIAWDKWLQDALASNNLNLAVMPGALQLLEYNPYDAFEGIASAIGSKGRSYDLLTLQDPVTGMRVNMIVSDTCPGQFSIQLWTQTKVIAMPLDMWAAGDEMEGVRFVNKIKVVNS